MIELSGRTDRLPLQLAAPLLAAPGIWAPGSRLSLSLLGALVTPPLGWEWDGQPPTWEARPGAFVWAPPRRPLDRFLRRLSRERSKLPRLLTLAPDAPGQVERALRALERESAAGYLLLDATTEGVAAARRGAAALPLLAEVPANEAGARAGALVEAGADLIWLGPPRVGSGPARLWGPAIFPLVHEALRDEGLRGAAVPLIAGAGIASAEDARTLHVAGAAAVALDPAWWAHPGLDSEVALALGADAG